MAVKVHLVAIMASREIALSEIENGEQWQPTEIGTPYSCAA